MPPPPSFATISYCETVVPISGSAETGVVTGWSIITRRTRRKRLSHAENAENAEIWRKLSSRGERGGAEKHPFSRGERGDTEKAFPHAENAETQRKTLLTRRTRRDGERPCSRGERGECDNEVREM